MQAERNPLIVCFSECGSGVYRFRVREGRIEWLIGTLLKAQSDSSGIAGVKWLAGEDGFQGGQSLHPLFAQRGQITPDTAERRAAAGRAEAAGHFLLDFEHPEIPLRSVVIEGNGDRRSTYRSEPAFLDWLGGAGARRCAPVSCLGLTEVMFEPIALSDGQPEALKRQSRSSCGRRSEKAVGVRPKALCDRSPLLLQKTGQKAPAFKWGMNGLFDLLAKNICAKLSAWICRLVRKTFKYKLLPTAEQEQTMAFVVRRCRELYNAALQERRDAWQKCGMSITCAHQSAELPAIKDVRPEYHDVHSQVLQDVLTRLDRAFQAFFRRVRAG